jgi:hypothetical protein
MTYCTLKISRKGAKTTKGVYLENLAFLAALRAFHPMFKMQLTIKNAMILP